MGDDTLVRQMKSIDYMMETDKEIKALSEKFDFSEVPGWYVLCFNGGCPLHGECLRYLAGANVPESMDTAKCVLPHRGRDGQCRWFDKTTVVTMASGFSHLYDKVLKADYTGMRKAITAYLHGAKQYYQYMRGERPLTPEQQLKIRQIVSSYGYDWEVPFDRFYESYRFGTPPVESGE